MDGTEFNLRFRQTMQKVHGELCGMAEQVAEIRAAESANASADPRVSMYMTMAILCLEMGRDLLGELGHKQPAIRVHLCIETIFSTFGVPLEEVYGASSGSVRAGPGDHVGANSRSGRGAASHQAEGHRQGLSAKRAAKCQG